MEWKKEGVVSARMSRVNIYRRNQMYNKQRTTVRELGMKAEPANICLGLFWNVPRRGAYSESA